MKRMWAILLGAMIPFAVSAAEIEAESGAMDNAGATVKEKADASGGKVVIFKKITRSMKRPDASKDAPSLVIKVKVDKTAMYKISTVVNTPNTSSDSVFAAVNDAEIKDKHFGFPKKNYQALIITTQLSAGEHQIKFWPREPNLEIDKIIVEEVK